MIKKLLWIAGLLSALCTVAQECPEPVYPLDGATGIAVNDTIRWTPVVGVTAYNITVGTTPLGDEITTLTSRGTNTFFAPPRGLPENSTIHVTLYLFNLSQGNILCTTFSFETEDVTTPPGCGAGMLSPADGATSVPVSASVRWAYSPTATGYLVSAGTTPGGSDLLPERRITDALEWKPAMDLDPETTYYVRIIPYNENGEATGCSEYRFTTGAVVTLPDCPTLLYPVDGTTNVPLSPVLSWAPVDGAEGYRISLGTTPADSDILDNADLRGLTETGVLNFDPNRIYYLTLTAYNSAGVSIGCRQTTFSTIEGCGPYFDADGDLIDLRPEVSFPESIGLCTGQSSGTVSATNPADGYRWYVIEAGGRERLLAETADFDIPGAGTYRHEIYNRYSGVVPGTDFECAASRVFEVVISEAPVIERAEVELGVGTLDITVRVNGVGDYEYALNDPNGPYQASNRFTGLTPNSYQVYVRDKNGCGTADILVEPDLTLEGFPRFFTPNGDGANDIWNYIRPASGSPPELEISIFDRYGNLVSVLEPGDTGWDGTYGGRPLPPSDYWFRAIDRNGAVVQGHFTLKR